MNVDEFLAANPALSREQIEKVETVENAEPLGDKVLSDSKINDCGLVYVRDQGQYAVMRATVRTCVIVSHIRGGRYRGAVYVNMNANDLLNLLQNNDGQNYDGYRCC